MRGKLGNFAPPRGQTKRWKLGRVQNCNLCIRPSSHEKLLVILRIGSTDLVKIAIALNPISRYSFFFILSVPL